MGRTSPWCRLQENGNNNLDSPDSNADNETLKNDITIKTIHDVFSAIERGDELIATKNQKESIAFALNVLTSCLSTIIAVLSEAGFTEIARLELVDMIKEQLLRYNKGKAKGDI